MVAPGKKQGTLYMTSGSTSSIAVASSRVDTGTWHHKLGHMSEKGDEGLTFEREATRVKVY